MCYTGFETGRGRFSAQFHKASMKHRKTKHGMSKTPQYRCWAGMKQRCINPNSKQFKDWGGRGITYDPDFSNFIKWWEYVEPMWEKFVRENPNKIPTQNRIDNDGHYIYGNIEIKSKSDNKRERGKSVIGTCMKTGKEYYFKSISEASRQVFANNWSISACCYGKRKSAGGYYWRFGVCKFP